MEILDVVKDLQQKDFDIFIRFVVDVQDEPTCYGGLQFLIDEVFTNILLPIRREDAGVRNGRSEVGA